MALAKKQWPRALLLKKRLAQCIAASVPVNKRTPTPASPTIGPASASKLAMIVGRERSGGAPSNFRLVAIQILHSLAPDAEHGIEDPEEN